MNTAELIKGRTVTKGIVEGEAIVTRQPFMFPHGLNPRTGMVIDRNHELFGNSLTGKVLVFPFAVGSTTTATWLLEAIRMKKAPLSLILEQVDPMLAVGALLAELFYNATFPVIDFPDLEHEGVSPLSYFKTGDVLIVDGNNGSVRKKNGMLSSNINSDRLL